MADRLDNLRYQEVADKLGLDVSDVQRAVFSFFDSIAVRAKKLPFDNPKRIYTAEGFNRLKLVQHIPFIGRIGSVYSRYLIWRSNEIDDTKTALRSSYQSRRKQSEIEDMAAAILSGRTPSIAEKKKKSELYDSVWVVGKDGKKLARQVIKKD